MLQGAAVVLQVPVVVLRGGAFLLLLLLLQRWRQGIAGVLLRQASCLGGATPAPSSGSGGSAGATVDSAEDGKRCDGGGREEMGRRNVWDPRLASHFWLAKFG